MSIAIAESVNLVAHRGTRRKVRAITVSGAVAAAAFVWVAASLLGSTFEIRMPGQQPMIIGLPMVLFTATLAGLAGWATLALLERLNWAPQSTWTTLAVLALVASFGPLIQAELAAQAVVALALMHVAVAAVLIPGLLSARRTRS